MSNDPHAKGDWGLAVFFFIFAAISAITGVAVGLWLENKTWKAQAVERGFAEWTVATDGTTEWKWKEVFNR